MPDARIPLISGNGSCDVPSYIGPPYQSAFIVLSDLEAF